MMRSLFVANTLPFPLNAGGNQRIYHLLRALAGISDVTLVCPTPGGGECDELEALRPLCARIVPFPLESFATHRRRRGPALARRLGSVVDTYGHPLQPAVVRWYRSPAATGAITQLSPASFDFIWAERLIGMSLLPRHTGTRVIVDLDDLLHRKLGHKLRHSELRPSSALDVVDYLKLRRLELGVTRLPYEFVVCSDQDRRVLGDGARIHVIPNGVEIPDAPRAPRPTASAPTFAFVGMMAAEANVDAVRFFVRDVLPLIHRAAPRARLIVVGANPPDTVRALHDGTSVTVTGMVPSVEPYLQQASAAVVPIRYGSGTRIKILEAMAYRTPVVSTTVGAEGLAVSAGRHLLIADTPATFAAACLRLASDGALRDALTDAGFELVQSRYSWSTIERHAQRAIARTGPAPAAARLITSQEVS